MLTRLMTIAASAALLAGAAHAQSTSASAQTDPAAATATTSSSTSTAPVDATGYNSQSSTTTTLPSGATVETQVVSNGPVPDTAENRAKYGKPDSHAGKRTSPAGN